MSLQKTSKVRIYSSEIGRVLSFLQQKGVAEIIGSPSADTSLLSRLDFVIRSLSEFAAEKKGLRAAVLGEKVEVDVRDISSVMSSCDWDSLERSVIDLSQNRSDLIRSLSEKESLLSSAEGWGEVSHSHKAFSFVDSVFVEIPAQEFEAFSSRLADSGVLSHGGEVSSDGSFIRYLFFVVGKDLSLFQSILADAQGGVVDLFVDSSPAEMLSELRSEVAGYQEQLNANTFKMKELSSHLEAVKLMYDAALQKNIHEEGVSVTSSVGEYVQFVEAYVPRSKVSMLQYDLSREFDAVMLEEVDLDEGEVAPVVLKSSNSLKPIQEVTKMYGTPAAKEIDPTPYYAGFFILFFGFCLTDAGYGLILMLLTGIPLLLKLPFDSTVRNVIKMFFYGGFSTFVLGILFGGYFGLTAAQVPEFLTYLRDSDGQQMFLGQIFNPMTDLNTMIMPLTYFLGFVHLVLGLLLSGKIAWDNGDKERTFFVVIPFLTAFLFAFLAWGMGMVGMEYIVYAALAFSVWGLGKNGNPVIRVLKGVGGLVNETLSWFQNILSYSRLFALGLATGVIAMAFNIIAGIFGAMLPGIVGILVMVVILIFGHTLNIALNVLGAYVHSSRLQFVEFFGLFLEGGGRALKPFKKKTRYRYVAED